MKDVTWQEDVVIPITTTAIRNTLPRTEHSVIKVSLQVFLITRLEILK